VTQIIVFTLVGAGLYLFTDWLLNRIERSRGARFENRSLIFFVLILFFALVSFQVIGRLLH